jgi:hypothetical protein
MTHSTTHSIAPLGGVEIDHLHCLRLATSETTSEQRRVTCMTFSGDGLAIAIGHSGALTLWSAEDGTQLSCTTSSATASSGSNSAGSYSSNAAADAGLVGGVVSIAWGHRGYR